MTTARNLEVAHRVDDNVKENMKLNHHIVHKVTAVQEDVSNIKDSVTLTKHGAQSPLNSLGLSLTFLRHRQAVIDETQRSFLSVLSLSIIASSTLILSQGINYGRN